MDNKQLRALRKTLERAEALEERIEANKCALRPTAARALAYERKNKEHYMMAVRVLHESGNTAANGITITAFLPLSAMRTFHAAIAKQIKSDTAALADLIAQP